MNKIRFYTFLLAYLTLISYSYSQRLKYLRIKLHTYELGGHLYHIELKVGTPSQMQSLLIDTGSSTTIVKSTDCDNCIKSEYPVFDKRLSSTYQELKCFEQLVCANLCWNVKSKQPCQSEIFYADGTHSKGIYSKDIISFQQSEEQDRFVGKLAIVQSLDSTWRVKQNGVLALGGSDDQNLIYSLYKSHNITQSIQYTICLSGKSGYLAIGEQDFQSEIEPNFTSRIKNPSNFLSILDVNSFSLGNTDLMSLVYKSKRQYQIVLDSGSSIMSIPGDAFIFFENQILNACIQSLNCEFQRIKNSQGFLLTYFTVNKGSSFLSEQPQIDKILPPLTLQINSQKYIIKASEYTRQTSSGEDSQRLLLEVDKLATQFVLGKSWLQNKRVKVDLSSSKVSVWMNEDCRFSTSFLDNLIPESFKHFVFNLDSGTILYFCLFLILMIIVFRKKIWRFSQKLRWIIRSKKAKNEVVSEEMNEVESFPEKV